MNILIIGNGFDLAHQLPTQYSDFLNFVKAYKERSDGPFLDVIEQFRITKKEIYEEIEKLLKKNVLIEYFLSIYIDRCKEGKNGWIDFESEISIIVRKLDEAKEFMKRQGIGVQHSSKLDTNIYVYLDFFINKLLSNERRTLNVNSFYELSQIDFIADII